VHTALRSHDAVPLPADVLTRREQADVTDIILDDKPVVSMEIDEAPNVKDCKLPPRASVRACGLHSLLCARLALVAIKELTCLRRGVCRKGDARPRTRD
jgi:hypothetical protein